jgi:hypothetical protein
VNVVGEPHCITCSDEGIDMTVISVDAGEELAVCETPDGHRETVDVGLVLPVAPADRLLIHAGTAIARGGGTL